MNGTKKNSNPPDNIKQGWLDLARSIQALLSRAGAKGYTHVTIDIATLDLDVISWTEPKIKKIYPMSLTRGGMTKETALTLHTIMERCDE